MEKTNLKLRVHINHCIAETAELYVMVALCFLGQESAYVWSADGDPAKIQTGVQCLNREGEEISPIYVNC